MNNASPGPLCVLSAGAPKEGVRRCLTQFEKIHAIPTTISFATAPKLKKIVMDGAAKDDVVVAPVDAITAFKAEGLVHAIAGGTLGAVAAGVVIRTGAALPDIASIDSFIAALRAADTIVYNTASSGAYIEKMIEGLGLTKELAAKTIRPDNGAGVMSTLQNDDGEALGFAQIPEIKNFEDQGVALVGALPPKVAHVTKYGVAALTDARDLTLAIKLANFMASDAVEVLLNAAGVIRN